MEKAPGENRGETGGEREEHPRLDHAELPESPYE